jgi:hypothetical protein
MALLEAAMDTDAHAHTHGFAGTRFPVLSDYLYPICVLAFRLPDIDGILGYWDGAGYVPARREAG